MTNTILKVKGMHCSSCSAIITKKIKKLPGVKNVDVNFATEKATIDYDTEKVSVKVMNSEIEKLGYQFIKIVPDLKRKTEASLGHDHQMMDMDVVSIDSKEEKKMELALMKAKTDFVLPLSLLTFFFMMWEILAKAFAVVPNLPLPMNVFNIIFMVLATIVLFWVGKPFLQGVVRFARFHVANMDTLVGMGTLIAYLYSVIITLLPQVALVLRLPSTTYFDVTIVVIGFVVFGKYLEAKSKIRTGEAIEKLFNLQAKTALLLRDGKEVEVPVSDVVIGDILIVKPGAKIPVDGEIVEGSSSIDESSITGESIPVDKSKGDTVIGATINKQGSFTFRATKVGSDTLIAQIIKMVEDAEGTKAPIQALADRISAVFVPVVLVIALVTFFAWLALGTATLGFGTALSYAIVSFVGVLVIACPCALGLATPTAIIVGVGKGAEAGILVRNAEALEKLSNVKTIVLDKTGTLTKGKPEVTDVIVINENYTEKEILTISASIEKLSEHPLGEAIAVHAEEKKYTLKKPEQFLSEEGVGVTAMFDGKKVSIHKPNSHEREQKEIKSLQGEGKTVVVVEIDGKQAGLIALSDTVKEGAKEMVNDLHALGIKVVMLTGDNHLAAEYIARELHIDDVIAEVLPGEKADAIKKLQKGGVSVAMVGDGVNDAPALVQAEVGIAMGTGTDIAIESAGITLLGGDIAKLVKAIKLSKMTMLGVKQNLFWAFIFNVIGIPLAAGLFYPFFGWLLNPAFAGLAMAFSSVSVVSNSLRIKAKKL